MINGSLKRHFVFQNVQRDTIDVEHFNGQSDVIITVSDRDGVSGSIRLAPDELRQLKSFLDIL